MKRSRRSTMLDLVQTVQDLANSDDEVVAIVVHMLATGRVILSGTFAGQRIVAALSA